ncbi:hypothetical protein DSO57_1039151 [Entomophthora muscae]|uniref:Uncharacterized protein n=1 Tax=Entomophthora muscae TaxID=34485 RepID=A0ACC2SBD7_9FUNG|nr:hypothetical protein DSO57_1039151 [Entomophthora muscae]
MFCLHLFVSLYSTPFSVPPGSRPYGITLEFSCVRARWPFSCGVLLGLAVLLASLWVACSVPRGAVCVVAVGGSWGGGGGVPSRGCLSVAAVTVCLVPVPYRSGILVG